MSIVYRGNSVSMFAKIEIGSILCNVEMVYIGRYYIPPFTKFKVVKIKRGESQGFNNILKRVDLALELENDDILSFSLNWYDLSENPPWMVLDAEFSSKTA
jgi:hypothetical protein